ncbi:MAG TPA: S8 family serine peptidase, partial [Clostridia bacterium]|nr:S8 family serine peptidase [Clostridia bacterium]
RDTLGLKGNGVKIGTIEAENTYLNKSNSQLYDRNIIFDIPDSQAVTDNHSTLVAAIIIGRTQGLVPNATLYCAGMVTYLDMFNKVEWLISQGVSVINMSAGTPTGAGTYTTEARWLDHLAIQHSVHFVKSAGNDIGYITNPGMAYNIVTVGAIDDNNSASEPYWPDDSMADFSSYMENTGIAFKPDLTAPGEDISAGGITNKGTSFAAPHVTGVIAQLIHAYPQLATKQTAMKAILAAGTKHKTATDYGCYSAITAYSNMEGAGVVDAQSAYYIAANSRYYSGQLYNSSFPFEKTFTVTSSDSLIRVSLVWLKRINISSPHPTGTVTERPLSDLDLRVYDPNGSCVKLSVTGNSNVELVEFVPQMTGTYKIIVNGYSLKNDFEYIGIAWF